MINLSTIVNDTTMEHAHDTEQDLISHQIPGHQRQTLLTGEETKIKMSSVPDIKSEICTEACQKAKVAKTNSTPSIHNHLQYEGEIVITGISGRFPESANLKEFENNLFNGIDMISDDERRWTRGFYGAITKSGKLKDLTRFDAGFFNIHAKQANAMDPQLRLLHELTYEAMVDAGVNPASMRGSRTGVYVGLMSSESEVAWSQDPDKCTGYEILGCVRSMLANRLSFSFDLKGPSMCLDTACSSSLIGLELAVRAMRAGHIDSAIIGGANLILDPIKTLQYTRLGMLSPDGRCKSFDISANGYARSEAAGVIFIQKRQVALRSYATILNIRANTDGFKTQGATFPSGQTQKKLLEEIYAESQIDPRQISYVEAHGTGTLAGDPQELNAITDVFCQNRDPDKPLLIGSVKSNMGHSEPTSGICGIAKIILMNQRGKIPSNLHFKTPNPEIYGLVDGKVKVVDEILPWDGGLVGLNSFGFGGSNVHVILKCERESGPSIKNQTESNKIPLIVPVSGRTRSACESSLKELTSDLPKYQETISLLHNISLKNTPGHPFRGFAFRKGDGSLDLEIQQQEQQTKAAQFGPGVGTVENGNSRPVWYVFSGVGSQFVGMGKDLMRFKVFKNSIETSAQILQSHNTGVDLLDILENSNEESLGSSVLRSAICITSIQVGMIDLLKSLGLTPDGIVGHSVGEVACAYADGCLTHEQTILTACKRAQLIDESSKDKDFEGAMAAVGLTWEEAVSRCPEGIYPACHNSRDSVTISGPKKLLTPFVEQLVSEGVFAKEVNSSGQAYHSPYISHLGPKLKEILDGVIPEPKARSSKWASSSLGPNQAWTFDSEFASSDYFVNNLLSPVRFHEVLVQVPENAVVIEIAPHCLLQAILKRSAPSSCAHVGLNHRNSKDNTAYFCNAVGRLYIQGLQPNFSALYDEVQFPISPTAPSLSSLVQWDHSAVWKVPDYTKENVTAPFLRNSGGEKNNVFEISLSNTTHEFFKGHCIDGMTIFPGTGYLCLVWEYFARLKKSTQNHLPVIFENVRFQRATILPKNGEGSVKFHLNILEGSGEFEIREGSSIAVSGIIKEAVQNCNNECSEKGIDLTDPTKLTPPPTDSSNDNASDSGYVKLNSKDAYKELRLRGYLYGGIFQGIQTVTLKTPSSKTNEGQSQDQNEGLWATLSWNENWVSYLDTLLHFTLLNKSHEALYLPTRFEKVHINPQTFLQNLQSKEEASLAPSVPAFYDQGLDMVSCPGVIIRGIHTSWAPRHIHQSAPQLEDYKFKPYFDFDHYKSSNEEKCKLDDKTDSDKEDGNLNMNTNPNMTSGLPFRVGRRKMSLAATHGHIKENTALRFCVDVTIENTQALYGYEKLKVVEITGGDLSSSCLSIPVSEIIDHQPHFTCEFTVFTADEDPPEALTKLPASSQMTVKPLKRGDNFEYVMENETGYHLVIAHNRSLIPELVERMSPRSFLLYHADRNQERKRRQSGLIPFHPMQLNPHLILIAHKSIGSRQSGADYYLYRKFDKVMDGDTIGKYIPAQRIIEINHNDQHFGWVEELKLAMKESVRQDEEKGQGEKEVTLKSPWKILLYSQTESTSGILGLVNCLKTEPGGHNIRCFLIKKKRGSSLHFNFNEPNAELQEMLTRDLLMNVYDEEFEKWGSFRHFQLPSLIKFPYRKAEQAYIAPLTRGDLSSLHWIQSGSRISGKSNNKEQDNTVDVYYTALNTRDVYWATGEISPDALPQNLVMRDDVLGMEIAGKMITPENKYKRVMAIVPGKGLAISVQIDPLLTWDAPECWTLAQSCSVPLAYSLAYYALIIRGQMRQGESILIHFGSGNGSEVTGLCQAAISIALGMESKTKSEAETESKSESKVFVCVKSDRERDFLKTVFPQLEERNFTTLTTFESNILKETGGRGVDLVLNTMLSGEGFHASIRILTKLGRFLDARSSFEKSAVLEMQAKNLSFHHIELGDLFTNDWEIKLRVKKLLSEGIEQGVVVPIQTTIFSDDIAEVEKAFRKMAMKNGEFEKILIQLQKEDEDQNQAQDQDGTKKQKYVQAIARSYFDPQKFYVLIGGLGGFGLELGSWMIERGARKIVLISRTGITNGYQNHTVTKWRNLGATVVISTADLTQMENARAFVQQFIPPVETLNVADDAENTNTNPNPSPNCPEYLGPLGGFINLAMVLRDALFENQTPENFEIVSSPKANVTLNLDRLTRELNLELEYFVTFSSISCGRGTPGQSNYGFANSIMEHVCVQRTRDGIPGKNISIEWGAIGDVGAVMDEFKNVDDDFVLVGTRPQKILSCLNSLDLLLQQDEPIVGSMVVADKHLSKSSSKSSGKTNGKKGRKTQLSLVRRVMNIMGMDDITNAIVHHSQVTLAEMGMDSLMGVEIKQMIENHQSVVYTIANVRKLTLGKLKNMDESAGVKEEENDEEEDEEEEEMHEAENSTENISSSLPVSTSKVEHSSLSSDPVKDEGKKTTDYFTNQNLLEIVVYPFALLGFYIVFFLYLVSQLLRWIAKPILHYFYGDELRLMDRPTDGIFVINKQTSNIVMVLKCEGDTPDPNSLMKSFEEKVLEWKPNVTLADGRVVKYEHCLYDALRWKISHNHLFYCWRKQKDFDVKDHFTFDLEDDSKDDSSPDSSDSSDLDSAVKKAAEFYLQLDWTGEKPQWEVCLISRKTTSPQQFALCVVVHHSYGDGMAVAQMLQYALADRQPPLSISQLEPENSSTKGILNLHSSKFQGCSKLEKLGIIFHELYKTWILPSHLIAKKGARCYLDALECPPSKKVEEKNTDSNSTSKSKRQCAWASIDYKTLKSLKYPQEIAPKSKSVSSVSVPKSKSTSIPLTVIVLACMSRVYARIYSEAKKKIPTKLIAWIPYGEFSDNSYNVGLRNNFSPAWPSFPCGLEEDSKQLVHQIQLTLDNDTSPEFLHASWSIMTFFSLLIKPLMPLVYLAPKFTFVFSSVPIHTPRDFTILNNNRVKSVFGFPPLGMDGPASLSAGIQEDSVNFSLIVDETIVGDIPDFTKNFFPYFKQEVDKLIKEFN